MKRAWILAALTAALAASVAGSAQAQQGRPQGMAADLLPPQEVSTVLASIGMRAISRPIWRGDRYVVFAVDRHGQEVRVVVDAHNGQVLAVRPRGDGPGGYAQRGYGYGPGRGAPPYGYDQGYAPPPPSGYPPARQAPYDPRYGATPPPPPGAAPGAPPSEDEDYFDNDRQQGSMPPPAGARPPARESNSRDLQTGNISHRAAAPKPARDITPVPRPRPELAKANDGNSGAGKDGGKDVAADPAKKDIRVIDLSKPEAQARPKPVEAIRF